MKTIDLTGQQFGRLTAIKDLGNKGRKDRAHVWLCLCECGNETKVTSRNLRSGHTQSCGCLRTEKTVERNLTHGMAESQIYAIWTGMKNRCQNPNDERAYSYYGARGIYVCKRWQSFENFYADMGEPPSPEHQIDRIDNDGPYSPENCRWVTRIEQMRNMSTNRFLTFRGKTQCLAAWAEEVNIGPSTISQRLKNGWSVRKALTTQPSQ